MKLDRSRRGFAALPLVASIALMIVLSLLMLFKTGLLYRDQAAKAQLRADYHQREEALLRALVTVFPKKAIACMRANYAESDDYSWDAIFRESIQMASVTEGLPPDVLASLGLRNVRSGNVGDHSEEEVLSYITSLTGVQGQVTPGTTAYADVFQQPQFAGKVPPLLTMAASLQAADAARPVVSSSKVYSAQDPSLLADVTKYATFNLIPYPNIRFGYANPGDPFVAKRNWWALTLKFGQPAGGGAGAVPVVEKHYILSLYEIPSQLPIEGAAFAEIGRHKDGTAWNSAAISIVGGVYADRLSMNGGFGASRIAGKEEITLASRMTLDGSEIDNDFDAAGVREQLQVQRQSDTLPVGLSANSGRLTFMPVKRGSDFLQKAATGTSWESYSRGVERCQISIEAINMEDYTNQIPTALRVSFKTAAGTTSEVVLERGVNWPKRGETGGDTVPFQTEMPLTLPKYSSLVIYPPLLNDWLVAQGGAPVTTNNSIRVSTDPSVNPLNVRPTPVTPTVDDMSVILREGDDMTTFTAGLSLVTPLRVYLGGDLNATPLTAPTGSGLASSAEYYPPMSIFAGELRVGTTSFVRPLDHRGQIGTLLASSADSWQPLDLKSGSNNEVNPDGVVAQLRPLTSPAELPPIYQMNWLVVLEEIQQD